MKQGKLIKQLVFVGREAKKAATAHVFARENGDDDESAPNFKIAAGPNS
jgi:hypothetical protein